MGFTILQIPYENIELYSMYFKAYYAPSTVGYVNPITNVGEERAPAVMMGVKREFSEFRAKAISEKERKGLIDEFKKRIDVLQTMLNLLVSGESINDFKQKKWGREDFSYVKFRQVNDLYRIAHLLGASTNCLLLSQFRDKRMQSLEQRLDKEYAQKELDRTLWHLRNSIEDGFYSFGKEYSAKLRNGVDMFEVRQ